MSHNATPELRRGLEVSMQNVQKSPLQQRQERIYTASDQVHRYRTAFLNTLVGSSTPHDSEKAISQITKEMEDVLHTQNKRDGTRSVLDALDLRSHDLSREVIERPLEETYSEYRRHIQKSLVSASFNGEANRVIEKGFMEHYIVHALETDLAIRSAKTNLRSSHFNKSHNQDDVGPGGIASLDAVRELLGEMKYFGVDTVNSFYTHAERIHKAQTQKEIDIILDSAKEYITYDDVLRKIQHLAKERKNEFTKKEFKKISGSIEQKATSFKRKLDTAWDYFNYVTPDEQKSLLYNAPKKILDLVSSMRNRFSNFAEMMGASEELREYFWQLKLGRDVQGYIKKQATRLATNTDYTRYQERVSDPFLRSEASGFEITTQIPSGTSSLYPVRSLVNAIEALVLRDAETPVRDSRTSHYITVLWGENGYFKLAVPRFFRDKSELRARIIATLSSGIEYKRIKMSSFDRASLTYTGHAPDRVRNTVYQEIYGFKQGKKTVNGDYLIQIQGHGGGSLNEHSPGSLFAVDSHKAAVLIDMRSAIKSSSKDKLLVRYNHSEFDGLQASEHFSYLAKHLKETAKSELIQQEQQRSGLNSVDFSPVMDGDTRTYPQTEGIAYTTDTGHYPKVTLKRATGEKVVFTPTMMKSLTLAMANGIDNFHQLYAQSDALKNEFLQLNADRFSNVQPAIVSFNHFMDAYKEWQKVTQKKTIEEKKIWSLRNLFASLGGKKEKPSSRDIMLEWGTRLQDAANRSKEGNSDLAVFSAVPGALEDVLYTMGLAFHKGAKMLRDSQGMISPMALKDVDPENPVFFSTAQSQAYNPDSIDILHPYKSIGVIGMLQQTKDSTTYVVRKLPSQAQQEFHTAVKDELFAGEKRPQHIAQTMRHMTTIVKAWDDLLHGKVTLTQYVQKRDEIFEKLDSYDACRDQLRKQGIADAEGLQRYLNGVLQRAAENTLKSEKIAETRTNLIDFLKWVGADVS